MICNIWPFVFNASNVDILNGLPASNKYDAIILAVAHNEFKAYGIEYLRKLGCDNSVFYDIKGVFPKDKVDGRL